MAKSLKNISQNIIIPKNCYEKFILLDKPYAHVLAASGVMHAGISRLVGGYEIVRNQPQSHLILCITKGCLFYQDKSGSILAATAGDRLVFPYGVYEHYWCEDEMEMFWFHLRASSYWDNLQSNKVKKEEIKYREKLEMLLKSYLEETGVEQDDTEDVCRLYAELLSKYLLRELKEKQLKVKVSNDEKLLEKLWLEVEEDLAYKWNIKKLAEKIYISPAQLHVICKKVYQSTPMQLVRELRLKRARDILHSTDYPLYVIADIVGYESSFALSRAFKLYYSISPTEMRKLETDTLHE